MIMRSVPQILCSMLVLPIVLDGAPLPVQSEGPVLEAVAMPPVAVPDLEKMRRMPRQARSYPGAPTVSSVSPDFGMRHGWTPIEISGSGFEKGCEVLVGGLPAMEVEVLSRKLIRARTPENSFVGSADVVVRNPDGKAGALLDGFLYEGAVFEVPGYNVPPDWNWASSVRLVDMNGDGRRDFLIAAPWRPLEDAEFGNLLIYLQGPDRDGDGVPNFERVRRNEALDDDGSSYSLAEPADLDLDGDMDFVATGNVQLYQFGVRPQINRVYLNDGECNFTVKDLPGNAASKGVGIGDVNGDGNPDLVIANVGSQSQLLLGDGRANFQDVTATHFPKAVMWTMHVLLVDVDNDRDLDAILANSGPIQKGEPGEGERNRLYLNDGKGRFTDATASLAFPGGKQRTYRAAAADIDRDGDLDLALAGEGSTQLLVNDGKGRFSVQYLPDFVTVHRRTGQPVTFSNGENYYVMFSDIDGDAYPDLVLNSRDMSVMFFMNVPAGRGKRTFQPRDDLVNPIPTGHGAEWVDLADVNGDGKPDLTIASGNEQTPLWINAWPEAFRFATCDVKKNLPYTDWVSRTCGIGDLDGDGRPDIVMGQRHERELMLFLRQEDGWHRKDWRDPAVLQPNRSVVEAITVADVDADGDGDILLGLRQQPSVLLLNDGKAGFKAATGSRALPKTPMGSSEILPVDVDLDGDTDLVMCNWERRLFNRGGQSNQLFLNQGDGRFIDVTGKALPGDTCAARGCAFGDVNGDAYPDIVLACQEATLLAEAQPNRLYLNRGARAPGTFVDASGQLPANEAKSTDAVLADVDGDGWLDMVFSNELTLRRRGAQDRLFHNTGRGRFEDWSSRMPEVNRNTWELQVIDFNRDGAPDLFLNRCYGNYGQGYGPKAEYGRLLLHVNNGNGSFSIPGVRQFDFIDQEHDWWHGSCAGDLDGDGYPELVEAVDGQVRVHKTFLRTKAVAHPVYAEVRAGQTVAFDASATHYPPGIRPESIVWTFGDGGEALGGGVRNRFTRRGTYSVTVEVTDNAGNTDRDRVTVVVK